MKNYFEGVFAGVGGHEGEDGVGGAGAGGIERVVVRQQLRRGDEADLVCEERGEDIEGRIVKGNSNSWDGNGMGWSRASSLTARVWGPELLGANVVTSMGRVTGAVPSWVVRKMRTQHVTNNKRDRRGYK